MSEPWFSRVFFWECQSVKMPGRRDTVMKEIRKVQKEIDNLEWKLRNDVVDEDAVQEIKQKIEDLRKVIVDMLETLPGMK